MSFNQYRTNPGQAVSNFKGRSDTPKAWPSTLVSAWTNGGLFGGGASETWILIASSSASYWTTTGKTEDGMFNNYDGGTQSDGSMMVSITGSDFNKVIAVTDKGVIRDNSFSGPQGAGYYYGPTEMNGFAYDETSDVVYSSMRAKVNAHSIYVQNYGLQVMPGTNVDTTSTTITDLKVENPRGSMGNNDKINACYIIDASTGKVMLVGSLGAYPSVVFAQVVNNSIVWGESNRSNQYPAFHNNEFNCAAVGDSGKFYYWGDYTSNSSMRLMVVCSSSSGSSSFGNTYFRNFNYTTHQAFNAVNMGTYSGQDQFALAHKAQMTGSVDFGVTIHTPNNGAVQYQKYIHGTGLSATAQPGIQLLAKDSADNLYALTRRENASVNYPGNGELVLTKFDSTLTVQWIRIINASQSTSIGGNGYDFYRATGITISNDDNYVTVMAELDFNAANNRKLFMSRFATDGSGYGALSDSGAAINIGGTPDVDASGRSDWTGMTACYVRYYDNGDASNVATVSVTALTGTWTTTSPNNDVSSTHVAITPPAYNHTNQANWYGSYPLESWA